MIKIILALLVIPACYLLREITWHEASGIVLLLTAFHISWVDAVLKQRKKGQ